MGNSTIRTANIHGYLANQNLGFFEAYSEISHALTNL